MELAVIEAPLTTPVDSIATSFGIRPAIITTDEPFIPSDVALFFDAFNDVACIEVWISEPDQVGEVRIIPPFRLWMKHADRYHADLHFVWKTRHDELLRALNSRLEYALETSGFAEVREAGYPDRLLIFPKDLVFAYEDPSEALWNGSCSLMDGLQISADRAAHGRTCTILKERDPSGTRIIDPDVLSGLLSYGHKECSFVLLNS